MSDQNKRVTVTLGVRGDSADFTKLKNQFSEFGTWLKASVGLNVGTDLYNGFKRMVTLGVEFNATLETAQLGIAAVLRTFQPGQFTTFDNAMAASAKQIDELRTAALSTVASFEELLEAYQSIAGAAFAAGIPMEKQVGLAVLISQAVAGIGMPTNQVAQEARALLTGKITADARLARTLGISTEDVNKAKQQGRLLEFLTSKMVGFSEAGNRASQTFSGLASNLRDMGTQVAGELTKDVFEKLKVIMRNITEFGQSDGFNAVVKGFRAMTTDLARWGEGVSSGETVAWAQSTRNQARGDFLSRAFGGAFTTILNGALGVNPNAPAQARPAAQLPNVFTNLNRPYDLSRLNLQSIIQPMIDYTMRARAPEGLAKSGLYTSFGAAIMAKEGLTIQRAMLRETTAQTEALRRIEQVFRIFA